MSDRETMEYDVVIVGAGPSGITAAIKLKKLAMEKNMDISVCIVEKGSEVGAHILSGAVLDPITLNEIIPDWKKKNAPLNTPVSEDRFLFLTEKSSIKTPNFLVPNSLKNEGNYIISLGNFCRWLATQAEELGIEIFPGFAAADILYDKNGHVSGIITGNVGVDKNNIKTESYEAGIELRGKYTLFAEGCRGHLGKKLIRKFSLDKNRNNQIYGIGLKELWEIDRKNHTPGLVIHSAGWPLDNSTYGGSYLYHLEDNLVSVGYVIGLGYKNTYLSPFDEFQKYKTHPYIRKFFKNGKRISYGARAISAGGVQSMPKLVFPGGCLIGDDAGFLNVSRIKGIHAAMKSGCLASEAVIENLISKKEKRILSSYPQNYKKSWLYRELYKARNFKPLMSLGLFWGTILVGIDQLIFKGKLPITFNHRSSDHESTDKKEKCKIINYDKPDGILTFDKLSSVFLSNTNHNENQPCHLQLINTNTPISTNLKLYDSPEQRYCPAGVYEIIENNNVKELRINAQNCVHCKTCDIKDPTQNINWVVPEGGGGPNYPNM